MFCRAMPRPPMVQAASRVAVRDTRARRVLPRIRDHGGSRQTVQPVRPSQPLQPTVLTATMQRVPVAPLTTQATRCGTRKRDGKNEGISQLLCETSYYRNFMKGGSDYEKKLRCA